MPFLIKRNTTKRSAPLPRRSGSTQITHLPTAIEAVRTPIKAIMTRRSGIGPGVQRPWSREKLPEGDWLYEIKHDGYRALAFKDGKDVRLVSRNKKAFDYPQLLEALKLLPAEHFILDGEIAALDEKGRSSFQLPQIFKSSGGVPLVYYAFDLLFLEGKDLRKEPLSGRPKLLPQVLKNRPDNIRLFVGRLQRSGRAQWSGCICAS
jgi:bifunctional non-homologous end joining protein LigD